MRISDIHIGHRYRQDLGDITGLAASIDEFGLLQDVVVRPDGMLVAGQRRIAACRMLGWQDIPAKVAENLEEELRLLKAQRDENTCRKDLTVSEKVARGQALEPMERAAAKERRTANLPGQQTGNFPTWQEGRATDKVATSVGMSRPTYEKAKAVIDSGDGELIAQMDRTGKVDGAYKETQRRATRPENLHISDDSYEWYTPRDYIEAARAVMGSIDLDPASCASANDVVQAAAFYDAEADGLLQQWHGNVWLNPPYNMPLIEKFIDKALASHESGACGQVMILTNNSTDTGWFHKLIASGPFCLTKGRIRFWGEGGQTLATRQGQAIFYLGSNQAAFINFFAPFGRIVGTIDDDQKS